MGAFLERLATNAEGRGFPESLHIRQSHRTARLWFGPTKHRPSTVRR